MGNSQGNKSDLQESSGHGLHTEEKGDVYRLKHTYSSILKHDVKEKTDGVSEKNMTDICSVSKMYGSALFAYLKKNPDQEEYATDNSKAALPIEKFLANGENLLHTTSVPNQIKTYSRMCCKGKSTCDKEDILEMLQICCALAFHCAGVHFNDLMTSLKFENMIKSMFGSDNTVTINQVQSWFIRNCDGAFRGVHSYTCSLLVGDEKFNKEISAIPLPELLIKLNASRHLLTEPTLWALSATLPHTYFPKAASKSHMSSTEPLGYIMAPSGWDLLYDSNHHGLSLNRFIHHAISYEGPNFMLISFRGHLFCLAVDCGWRDSTDRWGDQSCCLIMIEPQYKTMMSGGNMVYLNTHNRNVPKGIQVGKEVKSLVLQLNEEMTKISYYGHQQDLERIEMWGCGGSKAKKAQQDQKKWEKKEADKAKQRKLKPEDWEDNPDRQLLNMSGIQTKHAER